MVDGVGDVMERVAVTGAVDGSCMVTVVEVAAAVELVEVVTIGCE